MATDVTCLQCGKPYDSSVVANRFAGVCPACLAKFAAADDEVESGAGLADPSFQPPLKLGGTFHGLEVVELLGSGGMGVVYKARQPGLNRFVALKVLSPKLTSDREFVARFNREARAMAALSHPGIVQVFDFGLEADLCFLVMEYVDGMSLRQLMKERRLSPEEALKIVPKICEALEYAHSKGVIHRDIKPENILLDREGRLKIADFGLARVIASDSGASRVTITNVVMGTPGYMAPEQYQSMKVDHRADIYSLGAIFYEMLTGDIPVGRFDPPSSKVQIDVRLDEIVLKALATLPERRYQHAVDVKTDVEEMSLRPRPAIAIPGQPPPLREPRSLLWIPFLLIAGVALALGVYLVVSGGISLMIVGAGLFVFVFVAYRRMRDSLGEWDRRSGQTPVPEVPPPLMRSKRIPEMVWLSLIFTGLSYAILGSYLKFGPGGPSFPASEAADAMPLVVPLQLAAALCAILALVQIQRLSDRFRGKGIAAVGLFILFPPFGLILGVMTLMTLGLAVERKSPPMKLTRVPSPTPEPPRLPHSIGRQFVAPVAQVPVSVGAKPPFARLSVAAIIVVVAGVSITAASLFAFPYQEKLRSSVLTAGLFILVMGILMTLGAMRVIRLSKKRVRGMGLAQAAFLIAMASGGAFFVAMAVMPPPEAAGRPTSKKYEALIRAELPTGWVQTRSTLRIAGPAGQGFRILDEEEGVEFSKMRLGSGDRTRPERHIVAMTVLRLMHGQSRGHVRVRLIELTPDYEPRLAMAKSMVQGFARDTRGRITVEIEAADPERGQEAVDELARFYNEELNRIESEVRDD